MAPNLEDRESGDENNKQQNFLQQKVGSTPVSLSGWLSAIEEFNSAQMSSSG